MTTLVEVEITQEQEDVKRGANILDQLYPGWEKDINEETLNIAVCSDCAAGQIFGSYTFLYDNFGWGTDTAAYYGFNVRKAEDRVRDSVSESYDALRQAWIEEVNNRRNN